MWATQYLTRHRIKKAYRRKALELHPDRNYGDVEKATKLFAEVQSAYQVLSDLQERAWYDSHREAILRDVDVGSSEHFERDMKFTSATELSSLMGKFKTSVPFTDAPNGFYGKLRETFEKLAEEEYAAADWEGITSPDYPTFGTAESSYEDVIRPFYSVWTSFSTRKTFSWKDKHNLAEAPDRYIRRLMEKENKRMREEGIKEFNEAVRSLVMFVRKRDPRYAQNVQSEADRQKAMKEAAATQAARARAMHQAKLEGHVDQSWAQTTRTEQEGSFSESEESVQEQIECVICDKIFKSEKQYEAHEKSKKHIKAVQQLKRQMRKENKLFELDATEVDASTPQPISDADEMPIHGDATEVEYKPRIDHLPEPAPKESHEENSSADDVDDEYAPREVVEGRIGAEAKIEEEVDAEFFAQNNADDISSKLAGMSLGEDGDLDTDQSGAQKKLGKAKAKKAKKAAREAAQGNTFTCAGCNEAFPSKSKLFSHLGEYPEHAQPIPKKGGAKGKKSKR